MIGLTKAKVSIYYIVFFLVLPLTTVVVYGTINSNNGGGNKIVELRVSAQINNEIYVSYEIWGARLKDHKRPRREDNPYSKVFVTTHDDVLNISLYGSINWGGKTEWLECQILINGKGKPPRRVFASQKAKLAEVVCSDTGV